MPRSKTKGFGCGAAQRHRTASIAGSPLVEREQFVHRLVQRARNERVARDPQGGDQVVALHGQLGRLPGGGAEVRQPQGRARPGRAGDGQARPHDDQHFIDALAAQVPQRQERAAFEGEADAALRIQAQALHAQRLAEGFDGFSDPVHQL